MMKKVLITGASGFVGGYLCEYFLSLKNFDVYGTYNQEKNFQDSPIKNKIHPKKIDLLNDKDVSDLINEIKPDYLIHLAAASSPSASFKDPSATFSTNVNPQINILEAIRQNKLKSKILIISSCEVYGLVRPRDLPVNEDTSLRPATPYAVSKVTQDYLGLQYFLSYGLQCIRVRPFNHVGPRQSTRFVVSDFSKQIAQIEKGQKEPVIHVGNLEARRDFTDVRDIVRAYFLLLEKGQPGEAYNVGSGTSQSAKEILDILLKLSTTNITIKVDPSKIRPIDIPDMICNYTKLHALTSWKPIIPIEQTLQDTLDYWRSIV